VDVIVIAVSLIHLDVVDAVDAEDVILSHFLHAVEDLDATTMVVAGLQSF